MTSADGAPLEGAQIPSAPSSQTQGATHEASHDAASEAAPTGEASPRKAKLLELQEKAQSLIEAQVERLKKELAAFEEAARAAFSKRIENTKAEELLQTMPGRVADEVDNLLDRVGLVRKSRHLQELKRATGGSKAPPPVPSDDESEVRAPASKKKQNKARASA